MEKLFLNVEDFSSINLPQILKKAKREDLVSLSFSISDEAKSEKNKGNETSAKVLKLLAQISSMMMHPKNKEDPFGPFMQMVDGSRSTIIEDFTDEDFRFFRETVESIEDFRIRARVADVLWFSGKPTKEIKMAYLAIESYLQYPLDQDSMLRDGSEAWMRAIFLAKSIGKAGSEYLEKIESSLLEAFEIIEQNGTYLHFRLSELLLDIVEDNTIRLKMAEAIEGAANELFEKGKWRISRELYEDAIRWYIKNGGKLEKIYELYDLIANTWAEEAELHMQSNNAMGAGVFFQNAIDSLRSIPRGEYRERLDADTKLKEFHIRMTEANKRSIGHMKLIQTEPIDISPIIEASQNHVKDKPYPLVLGYLAHVTKPPAKKELRKSARKTMSKSIFRMLASSVTLSSDGRAIAKAPSVNPGDPNDPARLEAMDEELHMHFSIWIGMNVQGSILPALGVITHEHTITEESLFDLCKKSALVPVGRERFWAKGLYFGFQKDFMTAIHLLSPQLEHFVRLALKEHVVKTTTLDSKGIETENGLSTLLDKPESKEIFDEDFLMEMKMLLSSARGPNLRNVIAHGLIEDEEANSQYAIYFWWRMLRMMTDGTYGSIRKKDD